MLKNKIIKFIKTFFSDASNVLHFGSSLHSKRFKDIDLLILSNNHNSFVKELFLFEGLNYEVLIIPKTKIFQVIELDKLEGIYLQIIDSGKIIIDTDEKIKEIKFFIEHNKIKPSLILKKIYIERQFFEINSFIENINDCNFEKSIAFNDLIKIIIDLRLIDFKINNAYKLNHKLAYIKKFDLDFFNKLEIIKNNFYLKKNNFELKNEINNLNLKFISNKEFGSTDYTLNNVYNNNFIVYVNEFDIFPETIFDKLLHFLKELNSNIYTFIIEKKSQTLFEKGVYIVVCGKNKYLKDVVVTNLKKFIIKPKNGLIKYSIEFPYFLDINNFLGIFKSKKIELIQKDFILISNLISSNKKYNISNYFSLFIGGYIINDISIKDFIFDLQFVGKKNDKYFNNSDLFKKVNFHAKEYQLIKTISGNFKNVIKSWEIQKIPKCNFENIIHQIHFFKLVNRIEFITFSAKIFRITDYELIIIFHIIDNLLKDSYEN